MMSEMHRRDLTVDSWLRRRTYRSADADAAELLALKGSRSISVLLPAREVATTIGEVVRPIVALRNAGLVDEIVVIDSNSTDGTAEEAAMAGAVVHQRADLLQSYGPPLGKGDGIWRGLSVTSGEIVVMLDTDTQNFGVHFVLGLLRPLLIDPDIHLVKGAFERPLHLGDVTIENEGGRVTELVARPLLNLFVPQLAGFIQPLAGEVAARRDLLTSLAIPGGYGVEIAMLIDAMRAVGTDGLAQVDLGIRIDSGQPLRALTAMAYTVAATIIGRVMGDVVLPTDAQILLPAISGTEKADVTLVERPPLKDVLDGAVAEG